MNEFLYLAHATERETNPYVMPEWPEIVESQRALETPVWVEEWLKAGQNPIILKREEVEVDTWPDVFMYQTPVEAPAWVVLWLDWIDSETHPQPLRKETHASLPRPNSHRFCRTRSLAVAMKERRGTRRTDRQVKGVRSVVVAA